MKMSQIPRLDYHILEELKNIRKIVLFLFILEYKN